jgi:hypothetical protein
MVFLAIWQTSPQRLTAAISNDEVEALKEQVGSQV